MPANEQTRKQRIEQALDALPAEHETSRAPWRGQQARLPVIRIGLDSTVLNPRSHRIRAQLESNLVVKKTIDQEPDGEAAQTAIAALLRATPGFGRLRQNLKDEPQREPGIIDRTGRLINANTRAVALREVGVDYIEVMVLPADATLNEIYDLELDLQVAEDYRQDYSFTNQLLFVDDLISEQGRDEERVALQLRWASSSNDLSIKKGVEKVRRFVRHLDIIRDIQQLSGGKVPLIDFDDAEQTLLEFDARYEGLRDKDPAGAQRLKQARILGLLVGLGYDRQRAVDADWVETYLTEAFEEQETLKDLIEPLAAAGGSTQSTAALEGFEDFEDETTSDAANSATHLVVDQLVRRLSESAHDELVKLPTVDGEKNFERDQVIGAINDAMRNAAEDARNATKAGNTRKLPIHLVEEAAKSLAKARQAYDKIAEHPEFEHGAMASAAEKARRALDALDQRLVGE